MKIDNIEEDYRAGFYFNLQGVICVVVERGHYYNVYTKKVTEIIAIIRGDTGENVYEGYLGNNFDETLELSVLGYESRGNREWKK